MADYVWEKKACKYDQQMRSVLATLWQASGMYYCP